MLTTIRTILHPTDFGPAAEAAFHFACSLAREYHSEIVLLHVVEPAFVLPVDGLTVPIPTDIDAESRKRLERIFPLDQNVKVRRETVIGMPVEEIARVATECKADMVVMGTHGRGGFSRLLMGSVAEGVLRSVACPVLFVKEPSPSGATS
jgi:nucleotide-binding universal stress UspA family protein